MARISFKRHHFPPEIIRHAVWLYFRFTPSFRDVEEFLAQRGISAGSASAMKRCAAGRSSSARRSQESFNVAERRPPGTGASMRWFARSAASACFYGAPLTMRVRFSTSSSRSVATPEPH